VETNFEDQVSKAINELAVSVQIRGPFRTENHTNYIVTGLADTGDQLSNLCWCLLGFVGRIYEFDLTIDSVIGEGVTARENLLRALEKRLRVNRILTEEQKAKNRDALLQELIAHVLVQVHRRQKKVPEWLGDVKACRPPHLLANDPGIDLIAIGESEGKTFPVIGEIKAYETDPIGGLAEACDKFTQVQNGEYDDEIREAIKGMDTNRSFSRQQLADNIWAGLGRFGALVGHDADHSCDDRTCSSRQAIIAQDSERLFFIASPYRTMRLSFDKISDEMVRLANGLGV
jgi:hypothetical protein